MSRGAAVVLLTLAFGHLALWESLWEVNVKEGSDFNRICTVQAAGQTTRWAVLLKGNNKMIAYEFREPWDTRFGSNGASNIWMVSNNNAKFRDCKWMPGTDQVILTKKEEKKIAFLSLSFKKTQKEYSIGLEPKYITLNQDNSVIFSSCSTSSKNKNIYSWSTSKNTGDVTSISNSYVGFAGGMLILLQIDMFIGVSSGSDFRIVNFSGLSSEILTNIKKRNNNINSATALKDSMNILIGFDNIIDLHSWNYNGETFRIKTYRFFQTIFNIIPLENSNVSFLVQYSKRIDAWYMPTDERIKEIDIKADSVVSYSSNIAIVGVKDSLTMYAIKCSSECQKCGGGQSYSCLSCSSSKVFFQNKCLDNCPDNYILEADRGLCTICDPSCKQCSGSGKNNCISCPKGTFLRSDMSCQSTCPEKTFKNIQTLSCDPCHEYCSRCTDNTQSSCQACNTGYYFTISNTCGLCERNQFAEQDRCSDCDLTCDTCNGPTSKECLTCPDGIIVSNGECSSNCNIGEFFGSSNQCQACDQSCLTCQGQASSCTACKDNQLLFNRSCVTSCPPGRFPNIEISKCSQCHYSCQECNGATAQNCISCSEGFILNPNGECLDSCPSGYYVKEGLKKCDICHNTCAECNGGANNECLSCKANEFLLNMTCIAECPSHFFPNNSNQCEECDSTCVECNRIGDNGCTSCSLGFFLDTESSLVSGSSSCIKCDDLCETCSSLSSCLTCKTTSKYKILYNSTCLEACPIGAYSINDPTPSCLECNPKCNTCDNPEECLTCKENSAYPFWYRGDCLQECPDTFAAENGLCKCPKGYSLEAEKCIESIQEKGIILLKSTNYIPEQREVSLQFDKKLKSTMIEELIFTFNISESRSIVLKPESSYIRDVELAIVFRFNETLSNSTLLIDLMNRTQDVSEIIKSTSDSQQVSYFRQYPIEVTGISFYRGAMDAAVEDAAVYSSVGIGGVMGILMVLNFPLFFILLKFIQVLEYITFFNTNNPGNVIGFFEIFSVDMTAMIPNPFSINEEKEDVDCEMHQKFRENGVSCLFLNNMGSQLLQIFFIFTFYLICQMLKRCFKKQLLHIFERDQSTDELTSKKSIFEKVVSFVNDIFSLKKMVEFILASQINSVFGIIFMMRIKDGEITLLESALSLVCMIISAIMLVTVICMFGYSTFNYFYGKHKGKLNEEQEKTAKKELGFIIELHGNIKEDSKWAGYFFFANLMRDILFPVFLLYFIDWPYIQIIPLALFLGAKGIATIIIRPYKSWVESFSNSMNDILSMIVFFLFAGLIFADQVGWSEEQKYKIIGTSIVVLLILIIGINLAIAIGQQISGFIKWIRSMKDEKKQVVENSSMNDNSQLQDSSITSISPINKVSPAHLRSQNQMEDNIMAPINSKNSNRRNIHKNNLFKGIDSWIKETNVGIPMNPLRKFKKRLKE